KISLWRLETGWGKEGTTAKPAAEVPLTLARVRTVMFADCGGQWTATGLRAGLAFPLPLACAVAGTFVIRALSAAAALARDCAASWAISSTVFVWTRAAPSVLRSFTRVPRFSCSTRRFFAKGISLAYCGSH